MQQLDDIKRQEEEDRKRMSNNRNPKSKNKSNGNGDDEDTAQSHANGHAAERKKKKNGCAEERSKLVMWKSPFKTLYYFVREIPCAISDSRQR